MKKKIGLMILIICISVLVSSIAYGADLVISTAAELRAFATAVNNGNYYSGKTVELANDIDLENVEFTPIGTSSNLFAGTFDGKGYEIKNLYISDESLEYVGLFGCCVGANIKNLSVSGNITGGGETGYVGAICAVIAGAGTIDNCISDVVITSSGKMLGGICGYNICGTVISCKNSGNITSIKYGKVGGVVAENGDTDEYCVIDGCCNTGKLIGNNVGGICRDVYNAENSSLVKNCYNTGEIIGYMTASGIVDYLQSGSLINVYNAGKVTGPDASSTGGITRRNYWGKIFYAYNTGIVNDGAGYGICASNSSGTITDVYYLSGTASAGVGGTEVATVKTSAELKSDEMVTLLIGSQTDALWVKDINNINSGYPVFSYQKAPVIDTLAPTGTILLGSTYYEANGYKYVKSGEVTVNLTASDNVSEQNNIKVALINENNYNRANANSSITWLDFSPSVQWTASSGKGLKRVYVIFKDEAGNQSLYLAT